MKKGKGKLAKDEENDAVNVWWAEARYYDNSDSASGAAELAAGVDESAPSEKQFYWGKLPINISNRSSLVVPDPAGKVTFTVTGKFSEEVVNHHAGTKVRIREVRLLVDAPDGAKAAWEKWVATFYASDEPWRTAERTGPVRDRLGGRVMPPPPPLVIVPPSLPSGYYNRVIFEGTVRFVTDPGIRPLAGSLCARVEAIRA